MNDAAHRADVDRAMQYLPTAAAEAANPSRRGGKRQRNQQNESGESHGDERAFVHVFPDFVCVENLVEPEIRGEVQASVKKRKEPEHAAKANQLWKAHELAQRRDGQGDEKEAKRTVARGVLYEV